MHQRFEGHNLGLISVMARPGKTTSDQRWRLNAYDYVMLGGVLSWLLINDAVLRYGDSQLNQVIL